MLLIVVDQFGAAEFERISPHFVGGYRRLIDEGVVFPRAVHDHALTETAPGHATISTGYYPRHHGIVTNWMVDAGEPELIWMGDDDDFDKSPHRLMVPALADWLKARYPQSRVFTASAKARAAIMLGGKGADVAFWWEEEDGRFETSDYYRIPDWFVQFNQARPSAKYFGRVWEPLPLSAETLAALELEALDLGPLQPGFPHIAGGARPAPVESFYDDLWGSPWLDAHMAELIQGILEQEELGADGVPDLLAVSFSVADIIGHRFGPHSREYVDILLRQDRLVGEILDRIDATVGLDQTVVVLTADHGVVTVPEVRQLRGLPAERIGWQTVECIQLAGRDLAADHGVEEWLVAGTFLAPGLESRTGLNRLQLEERTVQRLEACPGVEKVWSASELLSTEAQQRPEDLDDERWLYANSYFPGRSADFLFRFSEYLMTSRSSLTTHGTSYDYDRQVPVVFHGPGTKPARPQVRFATVDIAPTLATLLDLDIPAGVDGEDRSELLAP